MAIPAIFPPVSVNVPFFGFASLLGAAVPFLKPFVFQMRRHLTNVVLRVTFGCT